MDRKQSTTESFLESNIESETSRIERVKREQESKLKRKMTRTQLMIQTQKTIQYHAQGISSGNSPLKLKKSPLRSKESRLNAQKHLGLGVSEPKKNYVMEFTKLEPKKEEQINEKSFKKKKKKPGL